MIRSTAKAIILDDDKVLLNKCYDDNNGHYYSLPGGGQQLDETLHEALIRECLEETGYHVKPRFFVGLCEEICDNENTRKHHPEYIHKVYHIFTCELQNDQKEEPIEIDDMQVCSEWIDIEKVKSIRLLPVMLDDHIEDMIKKEEPIFLGSIRIPYNHG